MLPNGETICRTAHCLQGIGSGCSQTAKTTTKRWAMLLGLHTLVAAAMSQICWQTLGPCRNRDGHSCRGSCQSRQWMPVGGLPTCQLQTMVTSLTGQRLRNSCAKVWLTAGRFSPEQRCKYREVTAGASPHTTSQRSRSQASAGQPILASACTSRATGCSKQHLI